LSRLPEAARLLKAVVSWLAPCRFQFLRWLLPQAFRGETRITAEVFCGIQESAFTEIRMARPPVGSMWTSFRPPVDCEESHWAMPEFLRLEAEFDLEHNAGQLESTVEHRLESALAHESGARSWELKVAATLARLLIGDNHRDQAQILLRSAISSFPSGNESNGLRTAKAILDELQHLPSHETSV
jgi:hypothetical protein